MTPDEEEEWFEEEPIDPEGAVKPRPRWRRWLVEFAVLLLIIFGVRWWQHQGLPTGAAPELRVAAITGESLELSTEAPTLVHFWATWCGVCEAMDGNVVSVAEDHRVITIATQSGTASAVRDWMQDKELFADGQAAFPTVADPRAALAQQWGVESFPTSFIVNPDGQIESVEVGYTTTLGLKARLWLAN